MICFASLSFCQNSVARDWNSFVIEAIRNDFARPTVHARNLYHHSIITYDCWAAYDNSKEPYFLGDTLHGYICNFDGISIPQDIQSAREEAISFASYRFIQNRFNSSPSYSSTYNLIDSYMAQKGYDVTNVSTDYVNGGASELGNYLAEQIQLYGYTDGSNEQNGFSNIYYDQLNPPIVMSQPGNPDIIDPNHWQPITLAQSIDQAGNPVASTPPHLSPEWGDVHPFSMDTTMYTQLTRDGDTYKVYFDTVNPAYLEITDSSAWQSFYKWNHSLVSIWQSHLDPTDSVMWDISPASIGNNTWYPTDSSQFATFYDLENGGDPGTGYALNPITGQPYTPQIVPRGDYTRVIAEFWADGLDSETPPGHWFEIYDYVIHQPSFIPQWQGSGPVLDQLEFDVKAHLALGGTMHDAAICAWSLKGYFDYIRPVSAIRYMADQGQSSDTLLPNYHPNGIPLLDGFIEIVMPGDTLEGQWGENTGKIKLFTWKGHDFIGDPLTETAGVGWILAENWWPYQRPSFVTPPFAGFVSGHSTFSRAAAHTMEFITGSPYFPGGMGEFVADQNQYLHFEDGPSVNIKLQWATYRDAADQCSLSRLWGGIHPPIDDIPGRKIGDIIGPMAFNMADSIFNIEHPALIAVSSSDTIVTFDDIGGQTTLDFLFNVAMDTSLIPTANLLPAMCNSVLVVDQIVWIDSFNLQLVYNNLPSAIEILETEIILHNLFTGTGIVLDEYSFSNLILLDTKKPLLYSILANYSDVTDYTVGQDFSLEFTYSEACDTSQIPAINLISTNLLNPTLTANPGISEWYNDSIYLQHYNVVDFDEEILDIVVEASNVFDVFHNEMDTSALAGVFIVDTENPLIDSAISSDTLVTQADLISPQFTVTLDFNEAMDTTIIPTSTFEYLGTVSNTIIQNSIQTSWVDTNTVSIQFLLLPAVNNLIAMDLSLNNIFDSRGNLLEGGMVDSLLYSDMKSPEVINQIANKPIINDSLVGTTNYYVDISFSEPMDMSIVPFVAHTAAQSITTSIQYNVPSSHFIDSTTFRAYFQILDANIEVAPVALEVQYAQDLSGNNQVGSTYSDFTFIDTKNPVVNNIYANSYLLDQWGQTFEVVAIYNEAMRSDLFPQLSFSPIMSFGFPAQDSIWSSDIILTRQYELQGGPNQTTFYDILLNDGFDLAGNIQEPLSLEDFFQINPFLGIHETIEFDNVLFPNVIESGTVINLLLNQNENNRITLRCINSIGQDVSNILFSREGNLFVSAPIYLASGMYYLITDSIQFKFIVK